MFKMLTVLKSVFNLFLNYYAIISVETVDFNCSVHVCFQIFFNWSVLVICPYIDNNPSDSAIILCKYCCYNTVDLSYFLIM